jgi:hypothetical protein
MQVEVDNLTYEAEIRRLSASEVSVKVTGGKLADGEHDWVIFDSSDLVDWYNGDREPQSSPPPLLRLAAEQVHEELLDKDRDLAKCHELCSWINEHDRREPDENSADPVEADLGRYLREKREAKGAYKAMKNTEKKMKELLLQIAEDGEPRPNPSDPRPYKDSGFTYGQLGAALDRFTDSSYEEWAEAQDEI